MKDVKFEDIKAPIVNIAKVREEIFERNKNLKAFVYALGIASFVFLLFLFVSWKTPEPELPLKEDLVEISLDDINLGNDLNGGLGEIQPLIKGDFSPMDASEQKQDNSGSEKQSEVADPITDDKDNDDAPAVNKPIYRPVTPSKNLDNTNPNSNKQPTNNATPTPQVPTPKVGGAWKRPNGTSSGNGADTDNGFRNQGDGTGKGDKGNVFGTPRGTGTRLTNANLRNRNEIENLASQSGTNYKGKVTIKVRVDENGSSSLISASASPATASSSDAKNFAKSMVPKMKFGAGADGREAVITLYFDF